MLQDVRAILPQESFTTWGRALMTHFPPDLWEEVASSKSLASTIRVAISVGQV